MFPYWAVFALFALAAAVEKPWSEGTRTRPLAFLATGIFLTLFIGLRYWVGGDWIEYQAWFDMAAYTPLANTLGEQDPAYQFLNWFGQRMGVGIWFVNLVCAVVFTWGLLRLARTQPRPWMVMLLSVPYLITVVAMGYTRQAVSIGLAMAAMADVINGARVIRAIGYIAVATFFHKTALVVLPLLALATGESVLWTLATVPLAVYGLFQTFLAPSLDHLVAGYLDTQYASSGAAVRVSLVMLGAIIFQLYRGSLGFTDRESILMRNLSLGAYACLALLFILPSSTVVDRLGLYLIPLELLVLARVPSNLVSEGIGKACVMALAFAVLFVWLTQGSFSGAWIPYRNYLVELYQGTL
ncbi:EpsG family protein [Sphingomonas sp.]|uniref:EpsG family protein n=1 Tax=Sphingomonas sp. TaxID=28214 RepID=UPI0025FEF2AB|nr:EpsG family protein [Sphingomonas sp.]MBV9528573.1 EpsG family protein [Sphingomonas sp.]